MCDCCKKVLYELDQQWGRGVLDYPKLRTMLNDKEHEVEVHV